MKLKDIAALGLVLALLLPSAPFAQVTAPPQPSNSTRVRPLTLSKVLGPGKRLEAPSVRQQIEQLLTKDEGFRVLHQSVTKRGFQPLDGDDASAAWEGSFLDSTGVTWQTRTLLRTYGKKNSKSIATVGEVTASSSNGEARSYKFWFLDPTGNFAKDKSIEYYVDQHNQLREAHSWTKCMKKKVRKACASCAAPCIAAAISCSGTFFAYLGCVGLACGGCLAFNVAVASAQCLWS